MQETISPVTLTGSVGSDVRACVVAVNKLIRQVSMMMPGVVLSDPGNKKGTSDEKKWRTEAFTFTFRGLTVSAAAQEKALTATTHDVAASKEAWFVLSVQTDGTTFTITKATDQTIGTKVLPTTPDNEIAVGYLQIVTTAAGIFDATSVDIEPATNVLSVTFVDAPYIELIGNESSVEVTS